MTRNPRFKLAAVAVLAALPTFAVAHNYTFIEGGYLGVDTGDDTENGVRIAGSADVHPNLALIGEYGALDDVDLLSAGLQFHTQLDSRFDWTAGATYERVEIDTGAGDFDGDGYGLRTGLRWQNADGRFELQPEVRYVDIEDNDGTSFRLGTQLEMMPMLDLVGAVQGGDDDRYELGLRYNFGPDKTGS